MIVAQASVKVGRQERTKTAEKAQLGESKKKL